jgi:hypothetical protein
VLRARDVAPYRRGRCRLVSHNTPKRKIGVRQRPIGVYVFCRAKVFLDSLRGSTNSGGLWIDHDFNALVLLVPEHLVGGRRFREINPMGYDEARIYLPVFNFVH